LEAGMDILVGYTGFVGSNICNSHHFDKLFKSTNIAEAFGTNPDLCVYCGVRAEKFLANKDPEKDFDIILNAIENIKKINPKKLVLISTADVYKNPAGVDENTAIEKSDLQPYGKNRYCFEEWVMNNQGNYHIIRLPGLFGENMKKNFIFDLIHITPSMLNEAKYSELSQENSLIKKCYVKSESGFFKCVCENRSEKFLLKNAFEESGFSALNFTDSRAVFQFYNLSYLWDHIRNAVKNDIRLFNAAVEPLSVDEIYFSVKGKHFVNELAQPAPYYNLKTVYCDILGGINGYLFSKKQVLEEVCQFIMSHNG
jgi:nucleoside-diphosphate-sugar epimerase